MRTNMEYQKKLSALRHLALKVQGQELQAVLLRAAVEKANSIADKVYKAEEIFNELKPNIYTRTIEMSWEESYKIVTDAVSLQELKTELIDKPAEPFVWDETLEVLLDGTDKTERAVLKTVLTNLYNHTKAQEAFDNSASSIAGWGKLALVIAKRIFTNFEVGKLVGVQPMNGPVGISFLLRYKEEERVETAFDDDDAEDSSEPPTIDDTVGRKMTLNIISEPTEAQARKLSTSWTIEAMQDLSTRHGISVEAELVQAIAKEIEDEIAAEIIGNLKKLAGEPKEVLDVNIIDPESGIVVGTEINRACNEIARRTRRGAGNWIVISPIMETFLQATPEVVYQKTVEIKDRDGLGLQEVGILNGSIKVFTSMLSVGMDEILIGYKGGNGETDTGYVYCPYVPVMSSGIVINPKTFQPIVTLMTRNGVALNGEHKYDEEGNETNTDCFSFAEDYYSLIKVNLDVEALTEKE